MLKDKLRNLREEKGLSQREIAREIAVTQPSYQAWESGISEPKATYIKRLAVFYSITADELLEIDTNENRENVIKEFKVLTKK
ncbi:MAG: helix-turn-helix transcriptional regulator [Clostridia bacterium]|nr:helix-turn-helix transcriptional regulator [Clostridia bacterium]